MPFVYCSNSLGYLYLYFTPSNIYLCNIRISAMIISDGFVSSVTWCKDGLLSVLYLLLWQEFMMDHNHLQYQHGKRCCLQNPKNSKDV